ncbi:branched chain amino acid aminotransferase [Ahniella affigens]|uniref:Branched-chain-amino-acid aminotransferase n=1 Tax=Ahniella affigens TaxID=2021234 RepID=A0A2P1PT31_9GAMM|nr:branched-chain-amino-acid transaminase [Ahniella affigens]AVP98003.1 branched chain amino acid aminotransferase [Ahniella affigens]
MAHKPSQLIWHNGHFVPWWEAKVHVLTHGLHYGSSVFEGIRAYATDKGAAIFRLRDHVERLFESARIHRMQIPYSQDDLFDACKQIIRVNRLTNGAYLRPIVFRGYGEYALAPSPQLPIEVAIAATEMGAYLGAEGLERGVDACISSWQRPAANTFPTMAKAGGNYLNSSQISMEAQRHGYQEGIALGTDGMLSEGGGENVFLVKKGVLYTPPTSAAILTGITRDTVMTLAQELGYEVRQQTMPREALYVCDEAFFTGTACEITPIRSIDGLTIGNGSRGPITHELQDLFFGLVKGKLADRFGWLDYVGGGEIEVEHDLHSALA